MVMLAYGELNSRLAIRKRLFSEDHICDSVSRCLGIGTAWSASCYQYETRRLTCGHEQCCQRCVKTRMRFRLSHAETSFCPYSPHSIYEDSRQLLICSPHYGQDEFREEHPRVTVKTVVRVLERLPDDFAGCGVGQRTPADRPCELLVGSG